MSGAQFEDVRERATPYLINTLFDSVFTIMGIVVGSAFSSTIDVRGIVGTVLTASISLGVSSGFSVYEAETIQEEQRIDEIEEALLEDLEDTMIMEESRSVTLISSVVVFFTPIFSCLVTLIPFALVYLGLLSAPRSVYAALLIDLGLIFMAGLVFGGEKRLLKGVRMTVLGILVFLMGYALNNLL